MSMLCSTSYTDGIIKEIQGTGYTEGAEMSKFNIALVCILCGFLFGYICANRDNVVDGRQTIEGGSKW